MTLPRLIRADCGHYVPEDTPPAGEQMIPVTGQCVAVILCPRCRQDLTLTPTPAPPVPVETKVVPPAVAEVVGLQVARARPRRRRPR